MPGAILRFPHDDTARLTHVPPPTHNVMSDHLPPGSVYRSLLALLRAGQAVETNRAVLEALFGCRSMEPELCEDGRATLLVRLPSGSAVYLTKTGELLVVAPTERDGIFRAQLFTGSAGELWRAVAARHPGLIPGRGALPRYWILREKVSPVVSTYAVFDLLSFEALERAVERDLVAHRVEATNSAARLSEQAA